MFSLGQLHIDNPAMAEHFVWHHAAWPFPEIAPDLHLHLGCGERVFDGFVNLDFASSQTGVVPWNMLDIWPESLRGQVAAVFSEDVLEHFYYPEQLYLLASLNVTLQERGVFRVLMPNLDLLQACCLDEVRPDYPRTWLDEHFGSCTGADALNVGMRMGGHRWLHNQFSLADLAAQAGFGIVPTSCAESTLPRLSGLNLRTEINITFANDLVKERKIERLVVPPDVVQYATLVEEINPDQILYCAASNDPQIHYKLPRSLDAGRIVLINCRSANLSQFNEHNFAKLYLAPSEASALYTDSTLRSACYMNVHSRRQIESRLPPEGRTLNQLRFDPGERKGDYFTAGPLEVFFEP